MGTELRPELCLVGRLESEASAAAPGQGVPGRAAKTGPPWFCSKHCPHPCLWRALALGRPVEQGEDRGVGGSCISAGVLTDMDATQALRRGWLCPQRPGLRWRCPGGGSPFGHRLTSQESGHLALGEGNRSFILLLVRKQLGEIS